MHERGRALERSFVAVHIIPWLEQSMRVQVLQEKPVHRVASVVFVTIRSRRQGQVHEEVICHRHGTGSKGVSRRSVERKDQKAYLRFPDM